MEDLSPKLPQCDGELSNFDFSIDDGVEDSLRSGKFQATYSGWNFNGQVWWDGKNFCCQPWTYHMPNDVIRANSLNELMHAVSSVYGYE